VTILRRLAQLEARRHGTPAVWFQDDDVPSEMVNRATGERRPLADAVHLDQRDIVVIYIDTVPGDVA
jgi:hypothetical protein